MSRAVRSAAVLALLAWGCASTRGEDAFDPRPLISNESGPRSLRREDWRAIGAELEGDDDARLYAQRRAYEDAIELLTEAIRAQPEHAPYLEARASLNGRLGFSRAAEQDFERAAALDPADPRIWLGLGKIRLELELPAGAVDALRRSEALGLDDQELHVLLARAYRAWERPRDAARQYALAVERPPQPTVELLTEASSLVASCDAWADAPEMIEKAHEWIATALERDPGSAPAWFVQGVILESCGGDGDAQASYARAVELDPESREAWTNLAILCRRNRDELGCARAVAHALELERDHDRRRALRELAKPSVSVAAGG